MLGSHPSDPGSSPGGGIFMHILFIHKTKIVVCAYNIIHTFSIIVQSCKINTKCLRLRSSIAVGHSQLPASVPVNRQFMEQRKLHRHIFVLHRNRCLYSSVVERQSCKLTKCRTSSTRSEPPNYRTVVHQDNTLREEGQHCVCCNVGSSCIAVKTLCMLAERWRLGSDGITG
jgi:hypothetical protein